MQTAVINFTTEEDMKQKAQKVARELGVSLSTVLNNYLKHFVKTKTVTFSVDDEEPSDYLLQSIARAEEDLKNGNVSPTFDNADDMIAYLHKAIK